MSLRLILMRHAKSSWENFAQPDHARPLNDRGRTSAQAMGKWLSDNGYLPKEVLCSSAQRTQETWARLQINGSTVRIEDSLYHAGLDAMLNVLQTASADTVLVLGHNPGIAAFAELLADTPSPHPRFRDYPTCATTIIEFSESRWRDVRFGRGSVLDFAIPSEIIASQGD